MTVKVVKPQRALDSHSSALFRLSDYARAELSMAANSHSVALLLASAVFSQVWKSATSCSLEAPERIHSWWSCSRIATSSTSAWLCAIALDTFARIGNPSAWVTWPRPCEAGTSGAAHVSPGHVSARHWHIGPRIRDARNPLQNCQSGPVRCDVRPHYLSPCFLPKVQGERLPDRRLWPCPTARLTLFC